MPIHQNVIDQLQKCAERFRRYAQHHAEKRDTEKQQSNAGLALECEQVIESTRKITCAWHQTGNCSDWWVSGCNQEYLSAGGTPRSNGMVWCPFCGNPLHECGMTEKHPDLPFNCCDDQPGS